MTLSGQAPEQGQHHAPDSEDATDEHPTESGSEIEGAEQSSSSPLENLPPELRVMVLSSAPDLPTLRALVHASPVLHAQYLNDRDTILRACAERDLHGFDLDVYFTTLSRVRELGCPRTDGIIFEFLVTYKYLHETLPFRIEGIKPSLRRWMAGFHMSVARPIARLYSNWALSNLRRAIVSPTSLQEAEEAEGVAKCGPDGQDDPNIKLSRSEEIRLYRAIYRFHTFHHLFGKNPGKRSGLLSRHQVNILFCSFFDPWEVEAIGCIDIFIRAKYEDIFNRVKADLQPDNSRSMQPNGVSNVKRSHDLEEDHDGKHTEVLML
jgi:hypothetical protein